MCASTEVAAGGVQRRRRLTPTPCVPDRPPRAPHEVRLRVFIKALCVKSHMPRPRQHNTVPYSTETE